MNGTVMPHQELQTGRSFTGCSNRCLWIGQGAKRFAHVLCVMVGQRQITRLYTIERGKCSKISSSFISAGLDWYIELEYDLPSQGFPFSVFDASGLVPP